VVAPGDRNTLRATVRFPRLDALPHIIARVRRVFDLGADPTLIDAHLARDPLLAPLVAARPGLRAPGAWDNFELAIRAILGQQISVPVATSIAGQIVAAFGIECDDPAAGALGLTHLFPRADQLANADVAGLGLMPGARAAAVTGLAAAVAVDPALLGPYRDLAGAVRALRSLPGIGDWTAQYVALRALREPDAFPSADAGLLRAMAELTGQRPTPAEALARADAWRPWRAYAVMHLWASLADPVRAERQDGEHARRAA
jgi:AraC family transcriptional regulator of adaptative response / DNA-3-methyladenine glycosylase II